MLYSVLYYLDFLHIFINQIIYSKILIIKVISNLLLFTYILFKIFLFERYGRIISITSLRACRMQTR